MSLRKGKRFLRLAALLLALAALTGPAWAKMYNVTANDAADLANKVATANTDDTATVADPHIINVPAGTYTLTATLTLSNHIKLQHVGSGTATLQGNNTFTIISVTAGSPTIDGFVITDGKNTGGNGGGMDITTTGTVTVKNCDIKDNDAASNGGGVFVMSGTLNATNCVFDNNEASGGDGGGGGICIQDNASAAVTQCTFTGNKASGTDGTSSWQAKGGGVYAKAPASFTLTNCTFTGNNQSNHLGGGLYVDSDGTGKVTVNFCTFVNNKANEGAEIYASNSVTVKNSLIWNKNYNTTTAIDCKDGKTVTLDHCAVASKLPFSATKIVNEGNSCVKISDWTPGEPAEDTTTGVPHKVFRIEDNLASLSGLIDKAQTGTGVTDDQLGRTRSTTAPTIGAVEFDKTQVAVTTKPATTNIHGTKGVALNQTVTFSTTPALDYTWSRTVNNAITGVSVEFDATNKNQLKITGKPTATGTCNITVNGTSEYGPDQTATVTLTVGEITVKPQTTTIDCKAGDKLDKSVSFTASGGQTGTYTWSREVQGSIAGVTVGNIDNTGKLTFSGTPTATGQITVTVKAMDSGESGTASVTLTVSDPEINVSSGTEGTSISTNINTQISNKTLTFTASPAALNYDWTLDETEQGGLTATLSGSGNTATLTLNGTPTKAESYTFTVKAAFGNTKKEVTVTVNVNDPSVTVTANPSTLYAQAGKELVPANCKSNLMASSASGGSENWTWTVDKTELDGVTATLSATTGSNVTLTLSGTPREIKDYTFTVRADAGSKANTATVTLKVTAPGGITLTPSATEAIALVGNTVFYPSEISFDAAPSQNYAWTVDGGSSAEKDGITATLTGSGNTAKLAFSGTPTAEGSYKFNVAAAFGGVAASQDITVTVYKPDVGFESVSDPNLKSKMEQDFMNLLNGVPAGTEIYFNMEGVHFANPDAFLISVQRWAEEQGYDVIANISPLMVENAPGVYFMKLNMSDDKRAMMTNSFNVDYHVERSADIEVSGTENNVVKVAADPAKDGSNGILVDEEGNPLGTYYNGRDLYLLVYLATSNEWYVQYLTMEQNFNGPTSNKGPGCDRGCNSGFAGLAVIALLEVLFLPSFGKKKDGRSERQG